MNLILASKSAPRRKALDILGLSYRVVPSDVDEKEIRDSDPVELVRKLSKAKAKQVGDGNVDSVVIGADLVVYFNGKVYEKPRDLDEAFRMLRSFSGNWVSIIGGFAVCNSKIRRIRSVVDEYRVRFRELSDEEIMDYINRYSVLDFAGAFEGEGLFRFAERAEGRYPFISQITFPMDRLIMILRKEGVRV